MALLAELVAGPVRAAAGMASRTSRLRGRVVLSVSDRQEKAWAPPYRTRVPVGHVGIDAVDRALCCCLSSNAMIR